MSHGPSTLYSFLAKTLLTIWQKPLISKDDLDEIPEPEDPDEGILSAPLSPDNRFIPQPHYMPLETYSRNLIVVHSVADDVRWVFDKLRHEANLSIVSYPVKDKPSRKNPLPVKGNQAMQYLTYIITRYDDLPDLSIFVHGDRFARHNNDLLDGDAFNTVRRLNSAKVVRDG